ncbi:HAMP domain-containing histidine kinase [Myxococcota bacterium]|nr:HAMP domain-containing histidine kinase [Myxococcota bacterium]MBU1537402.1 HAMP domain-containing histidine kinase [Myxococcota bacterium]
MTDTLLQRLQKFSARAKLLHILLILFPTILTSTVGIVSLALYDGFKDVIFGVLTIVFAVAVLTGAIITYVINNRTAQLARRQSAFLANVSHELRSPLAIIKLHAQTLSDKRFKKSHEMCVNYIIEASDHLDELIQQILQWKRITSSHEIVDRKSEVANLPAQDAIAKILSVKKDLQPSLHLDLLPSPPTIFIDRQTLSRAIFNLLENAYKYTGETKKITLTTKVVTRKEGKKSFFAYTVTDNGVGIEEHNKKLIFTEFFRASDKAKGAAGIGLGLGIVKSIVSAHKGRVEVESEIGVGSTFTLLIPMKTEAGTSQGHTSSAQ